MRILGIILVSALWGLSACGEPTSDVQAAVGSTGLPSDVADEAGEALTGVSWEDWTPRYGQVRPATEEIVDPIRARVAARNTTSWTGREVQSGVEVSYAPEHLRWSWGHVVAHLDPRESLLDRTVTVCLEAGCSDSGQDDEAADFAEALLGESLPLASQLLDAQVEWEANLDEAMDEGVNGVATVQSPAGPWDCFVHGQQARAFEDLTGTEVVALTSEDEGVDSFVSLCIDQRGLVVLNQTSTGGLVMAQYDEWHAGVDDDIADLVPAEALPEPTPVDPTGDYEDASWVGWEGVLSGVRPATDDDVNLLRARIRARNATAWTGVVEAAWTLSVTPDHVRAKLGDLEWHFDPSQDLRQVTYVVCLEGECARVGSNAETDGPHVFNNDIDSMTFLLMDHVLTQLDEKVLRPDELGAYALVNSPIGPLDCLVHRRARPDVSALEGTSVVREHNPLIGGDATVCVDQRGLVTRFGDPLGQTMVLDAWRDGVDPGYDKYPGPVRDYNDHS